MKKTFILAVVIVTVCFNVHAQKSVQVNATIKESFNQEFNTASNVVWEKISNRIFLVRFDQQQGNSIAYFDNAGKLLVSGQKIAFSQAPRLVQHGLQDVMMAHEKKSGPLSVSHIYELAENGVTKYYANMGNSNLFLAVMSSANGKTTIVKKSNTNYEEKDSPIIVTIK